QLRPVPPPADRSPGLVGRPGRLATGGTAGTAAMGYGRATRPMPGAGLVPPKANYPERARPGEERPNPDAGVEPFRAAGAEPAPAADGASQPGAGSGPATASKPADAAASPPADAAASPPGTPLPRRLATPPLRPPTPSLPSQPGTDSGGFRGTAQASFPFAARPATKPGAAGTWQPNAGAGPFPAATDTPAAGTGLPGTGSAEPGGPAPWGGGASTGSAADASGAGSPFPPQGAPSTDDPRRPPAAPRRPAAGQRPPAAAHRRPALGHPRSPVAPGGGDSPGRCRAHGAGPAERRARRGHGQRGNWRQHGDLRRCRSRCGAVVPSCPPGRQQRELPGHAATRRRRRVPAVPAGARNRQRPARSAGPRGPGLTRAGRAGPCHAPLSAWAGPPGCSVPPCAPTRTSARTPARIGRRWPSSPHP